MRVRDVILALTAAAVATLLFVLAMGARVLLEERNAIGPFDTVLSAQPPDRVPVLCYHYVRGPSGPLHLARVFGYVVLSLPLLDDTELWKVSASGFERQMTFLGERGYRTITLDDLHEWQMGRRELPPNPVVITFDDADVSVYDEAFPILQRLGLRATVFAVTAQVGKTWSGIRCLDWQKLREMQDSGVFDIESHTDDLHYKVDAAGTTLPVFVAASEHSFRIGENPDWRRALRDDLVRSRNAIRRHLGREARFLAWPYGFGNPALDRLALEAGFARTFALKAGTSRRFGRGDALLSEDTPRFEIPRYTITARTSLRDFRAMLEGTYQPDS